MTSYRRKQKPGDRRLIHDESADPVERASAYSRLAFDECRFEEGHTDDLIALATRWLSHEEPILRSEAVDQLLAFWQLEDRLEAVVDRLHDDVDRSVRCAAAISLSAYLPASGSQRSFILRALVRRVEHDDDVGIQRCCYEQLLQHLAPERAHKELPLHFDRDRDVDWDLLAPYCAPAR